jgi:hypothetical protein
MDARSSRTRTPRLLLFRFLKGITYLSVSNRGASANAARSINNRHEIVGRGDDPSVADGINNQSHIVGRYADSSGMEHGYLALPRDDQN